jgi:hypothetical protein
VTRSALKPEPVCCYRIGTEPGDRAELVAALARLLFDLVQRKAAAGPRNCEGQGLVQPGEPARPEEVST